MTLRIAEMIAKSRNEKSFSKDELVEMLSLPPDLPESYLIMAEANHISKQLTGNKAEIHAQFAQIKVLLFDVLMFVLPCSRLPTFILFLFPRFGGGRRLAVSGS